MSKTAMIGTLTAQDGKADEMEAVLADMVDAANNEPGTEVYAYFRAPDDTFHFFAIMTDEASMQGHGQSAEMQAAMQAFMPLMAAPPNMTPARPIKAIGLDV